MASNLKGKCLFIDNAKIKPKVTNPNRINFAFSNRFEPSRFMNNNPDLGNDIDNSEDSDLQKDVKRAVRNSQQNSKYISKRRPPVVVNVHPGNQTTFSIVLILSGDKSYCNAVTAKYSRIICIKCNRIY